MTVCPLVTSIRSDRYLQKSRVRALLGCLTVAGAMASVACSLGTEPGRDAVTESDSISVSVPSLTVVPGSTGQVIVTVKSQGGRLTISGLTGGMRGTFEPEFVKKGIAKSTLTLTAGWESPVGEAVLTIGAVGNVSNGVQTLRASATLRVNVGCPGYAIPLACPPFPTGGERTVWGVVLERNKTGTRPAAGVSVWAWVQRPTNGYSAGRVETNALGEYGFSLLPDAQILMQAGGPGYDQPCASLVRMAGSNLRVDLEVVSSAEPIVEEEPAAPALVGMVYETTPEGRRPLAGARIYVEVFVGIVAATTTTDAQGRYSLCRLPAVNSDITAVKSGYSFAEQTIIVDGVTTLDIEMKRQ